MARKAIINVRFAERRKDKQHSIPVTYWFPKATIAFYLSNNV